MELIQAGGFGRVRDGGFRGIIGRVRGGIQAEAVEYRFRY